MANTVPPSLSRDFILSTVMEHLRAPLLPLASFSTAFKNVPLEGTNRIVVPYIPKQTANVKDYSHETGYVIDGNTNRETREITVNRHKYIDLSYSDTELARQPFLMNEEMLRKKAEGLAEEVLTDILSVVTAANYPATPYVSAATAFQVDDVIDIRTQCNNLNWSKSNRSIILDHDYEGNLVKDTRLANYDYGANNTISTGGLPKISGFSVIPTEYIPDNGINLVGMAVDASAIGVAFSPIAPAKDFSGTYQTMEDPDGSGLTLEYYSYYDNSRRTQIETINVAYGYNALEADAIVPIVSA